ncbi:MAG: hypothetical protein JRM80_00235 [Nitrososphaerota archaeon]|nr:hypothetical protein [Nitrososphaerota archaeon]
MGLWTKLAAAFLGILLVSGPLWPAGLCCFLYLAVVLRPKSANRTPLDSPASSALPRRAFGLALFFIGAVALGSGGVFSPFVFFAGGAAALFAPSLRRVLLAEVAPIGDSVLLRTKRFPLEWHSVAEFKAGSDSFARSLSSFEGTILIFAESGKAFALASCFAFGRKDADSKLQRLLKSSNPGRRGGAYLLPLDASYAAEVLGQTFSTAGFPTPDLVKSASSVTGAMVLECARGTVVKASSLRVGEGSRSPRIPRAEGSVVGRPLVWEVLDSMGKRTRWPDPDSFSSLLDSLSATKGEHLGDRLKEIEEVEGEVKVQGLAGGEVRVTRPQLRAIVSVYS